MLRRAGVLLACVAVPALAELVRIEVVERSPVLDGRSFGPAGAYERIIGRAHFAVDPKLPANRIITDVALAPRNAQGRVEFSSDIYILQPRDPARGNGAVLYEVSNRGKKFTLGMFNRAANSLDPRTEAEFGDGLLMEQGYTLLWLGWQPDVPRDPKLVRLYAPALKGGPGLVRAEIVLDERATRASLADRGHIPYPVANPDDPKLTLNVRDRADGPRQPLPRAAWRIENGEVAMSASFEPGRIYELVYTSRDPVLVGLGPTAVRDAVSYLKRGRITRAYGFGVSQSGRFLRTFLYYGFNRDEQGHKVFDGMLVHVAGAGRGSFNHRFAQPSRDGHPFFNILYPTDIFPFTDLPQTDSETGLTEGLLTRAGDAVPRIFYTNSSYEYYGRAASLTHTTLDAKRDAPLAPGTRIYLFAGGQHGPAAFPPPRANTQNRANPNQFTHSMRALLLAMDAWVREGKEPPPSLYPRIEDAPRVRGEGLVTIDPPRTGSVFPTLVPQVNQDGSETSVVRMPEIAWPLATYTGWNLRVKEIGAPDELFSMVGSFIPFARTRAERERTSDPRLSIEERYASRAEY